MLTQFSALALGLFSSAGLAAQLALGAGAEYTRGDYGTAESTSQWVVPVSAAVQAGRWQLGARVPFVSVEGTVNSEVGGLGAHAGGAGAGSGSGAGSGTLRQRTAVESQSGLGDTVLDASFTAVKAERFELDVGAGAKLVTADRNDDLITTGSADYFARLDAFALAGRANLTASLAWTRKGDIHVRDDTGVWTSLDVDDPLAATAGASFPAGAPTRAGAELYWRQGLYAGADAATEARAFVTHRAGALRVRFYALAGFSDASPDFGAGVALSRTWGGAP